MAGNSTLNIQASARQPGKHTARDLRKGRQIPAVVYGPKTKPLSLSISEGDAVRYSRHGYENSIFTIQSENSDLNGLKVLKKSTDIHPVSRRPVHMDFFAPDMSQAVRVNVEIRFSGKAIGTTEGGLVSQVRRDVEIECLPLEIPEHFTLDITDLGLNQSMHVSDLNIPANFRVITSAGETVVTCAVVAEESATPTAAAEATPAAGAAAAPAAGAAAPAAKK